VYPKLGEYRSGNRETVKTSAIHRPANSCDAMMSIITHNWGSAWAHRGRISLNVDTTEATDDVRPGWMVTGIGSGLL
jgi:hypothetical protein